MAQRVVDTIVDACAPLYVTYRTKYFVQAVIVRGVQVALKFALLPDS
jgi:hypothetical protein